MQLDLNKQFIGLDEKPLEGDQGHMGKFLAQQMAGGSKGDLLKVMPWARKLFKLKPIEIDKADQALLKSIINELPGATLLAKEQLIEQVDALKEA